MPNHIWSDGELGEQAKRVEASAPNRVFYEQGRYDCMKGYVIPPRYRDSIELLQWETGWSDELKGIPRPYDD